MDLTREAIGPEGGVNQYFQGGPNPLYPPLDPPMLYMVKYGRAAQIAPFSALQGTVYIIIDHQAPILRKKGIG